MVDTQYYKIEWVVRVVVETLLNIGVVPDTLVGDSAYLLFVAGLLNSGDYGVGINLD